MVVVLKQVYSQLGAEFMVLLPETIPFLAELLEGVHHLELMLLCNACASYMYVIICLILLLLCM